MNNVDKIIILMFCVIFSIGTIITITHEIYSIFRKEKPLKVEWNKKDIFCLRRFKMRRKRKYYKNHR